MVADNKSAAQSKKRCPTCKREFDYAQLVCAVDGTILTPLMEESLIGTVLAGKYELLSEIGRGGMSIIYKARHQLMDRLVAIKMLQARLLEDETNTKRFRQEAQAASCLAHPNIISVHDFGIAASGQPYLVMDLLIGQSLAEVIKRDNHVEPVRTIRIAMQTCDALGHAHEKGVIHRDLKSSNIMLAADEGKQDVVKVVDFGIAKFMPAAGKETFNLTRTGEVFGSPIYMSPEQCLGRPLDARSDIYSMGVVLYEALTGFPPLMGNTIMDTMQMHVESMPKTFEQIKADLPIAPELQEMVLKALEKDPTNRYQTMKEFFDILEAAEKSIQPGTGRRPPVSRSELNGLRDKHLPGGSAQLLNEPLATIEKDHAGLRYGARSLPSTDEIETKKLTEKMAKLPQTIHLIKAKFAPHLHVVIGILVFAFGLLIGFLVEYELVHH